MIHLPLGNSTLHELSHCQDAHVKHQILDIHFLCSPSYLAALWASRCMSLFTSNLGAEYGNRWQLICASGKNLVLQNGGSLVWTDSRSGSIWCDLDHASFLLQLSDAGFWNLYRMCGGWWWCRCLHWIAQFINLLSIQQMSVTQCGKRFILY